MDNSFKTLIDSAQEVLILLPTRPLMDQVAGGLSLYLSLLSSNKNVSITCPASMTAEYSRLIGIDKINSNLGDKNLMIKFVNFQADDIDKVRADVENGLFTLFVSPKLGKKVPTKDQIDIKYSGNSIDLVILIGGANDGHFPIISSPELSGAKLIHVGTRLLEITDNNLQVLSFARSASSTSELIAILLKESDFVVDADIATNLLAGIEEQSKNFQSPDVTVNTFEIFAELLKLGGQRSKKVLANTFPKGAIPNKPFNEPQEVNNIQPLLSRDESVSSMTPEEAEVEIQQDIPPSWSEPKIYTGTSLS
ncbi:MAG TPA: hypothetical protein VI795_01190 [Patescibacteria group bacterium]|nr:hypothetical protein [Patescibacteria group bacterium]